MTEAENAVAIVKEFLVASMIPDADAPQRICTRR